MFQQYSIKELKKRLSEFQCSYGNGFDLLKETVYRRYLNEELDELWDEAVGGFTLLKEIRTQHDYSDLDIRYIFTIGGNIYALDTHQDSFGDGEFNETEFYEVKETTKTIQRYERKE